MLGQLHDRRQRDSLAAGLGHESRPQAVPTKIPLQPGQACPPLHDLPDGGRGEGGADALLPHPPEDRALGDPGRFQPVLQCEGGPIEHRLVWRGGRGDAGLLCLAVLKTRLEAQVEELTGQREAADQREAGMEAARQVIENRLQTVQQAAEVEREGFLQHIRAVEDRANAEVDRTRQEVKDLKVQLKEQAKAQAVAAKAARQLLERASAEAKDAQRELSIQRTRAEAAESRLGHIQDVSEAVEAAIRRAGASSEKKTGRSSGTTTQKKRSKMASVELRAAKPRR